MVFTAENPLARAASSPQSGSSNGCFLLRYHYAPFFVRLSFRTSVMGSSVYLLVVGMYV